MQSTREGIKKNESVGLLKMKKATKVTVVIFLVGV